MSAELPTPVNVGVDAENGTWEWQFNDTNGEWQVENIVKYKDSAGKISTIKAIWSQDTTPTYSIYLRDETVDKRGEGGRYFLHLDKIYVDGTEQAEKPDGIYVFINPGANPKGQYFTDSFNYVTFAANGENKTIGGVYKLLAMGSISRFQTTDPNDTDDTGSKYYCPTSTDASKQQIQLGYDTKIVAVPDTGGSYKINARVADMWNNFWGNSEALYTNTAGAMCFDDIAGGSGDIMDGDRNVSGTMAGLYVRGTGGKLGGIAKNGSPKRVTVPVITDAAKAACASKYIDPISAASQFETKLPELLVDVINEVDPTTVAKKAENIATLADYYKKMFNGDPDGTFTAGPDKVGLHSHYFGDLGAQKYSSAVLTDKMTANIRNEMTMAKINDWSDVPPNFFEKMFSALGKKAGENPGATVVSLVILGQVASRYGLQLLKVVGQAAIANPIGALAFLVLASSIVIAWNGVQAFQSYWNDQYRSFALYSLFVWYLSSLNAEYKGCIVEKGGLEANLAAKTGFSQKALDLQLKNTHLVKHVAGEANNDIVNSMPDLDECGCPKNSLSIAGFNIVGLFTCVICSVFKLLYEGVEKATDFFQKQAMKVVRLVPSRISSRNIDIGPPYLIRAG